MEHVRTWISSKFETRSDQVLALDDLFVSVLEPLDEDQDEIYGASPNDELEQRRVSKPKSASTL